MKDTAYEINIDGLVGPTHHYGGLATGNLASQHHKLSLSNPKEAALQGLKKMHFMMERGFKQALLPPHERPNINLLKQKGFSSSSNQQIIEKAFAADPSLVSACHSASSMWTANAATISPSFDTENNKVHITPANLLSHKHRSQETAMTTKLLKKIFNDKRYFQHHPALSEYSDEGAANHTRLCQHYGKPGIEWFVYGENSANQKHPARQHHQASQTIARTHTLKPQHTIFSIQNPKAIDTGVFHNDVIAVGNKDTLLFHEEAFANRNTVLDELQNKTDFPLHLVEISKKYLSLEDAVSTYLFNSQLLSLDDDRMMLLAPKECEENKNVKQIIDYIIKDNNPVSEAHFIDCHQSMKNGGGPACLRLRVVLTEDEIAASHQGVYLTEALYQQLIDWVNKHYRDKLSLDDLIDSRFLQEIQTALDELTQILDLGSVYEFQR